MKSMKNINILNIIIVLLIVFNFNSKAQERVLKSAEIGFSSDKDGKQFGTKTDKVESTLNTETGEVSITVDVMGLVFDKDMMTKHFRAEGVMNAASFPVITFKGKIVDVSKVNFKKDGEYDVMVKGKMNIKGVEQEIEVKASITIKKKKMTATTNFDLARFDYGVKGKEKYIANTLQISVELVY